MKNISIIVALSQNRVIGKDNGIPWSLPDDMKYFRKITLGAAFSQATAGMVLNHVIMGRKNWESIPEKYRPLPMRKNWVLTRSLDAFYATNPKVDDNVLVYDDLRGAIDQMDKGDIFIIGGGEIYALALPLVNKLYLTEIKADIEGDVFFPEIDMSEWKEISREHHDIDAKHKYEFDFVIYERQ